MIKVSDVIHILLVQLKTSYKNLDKIGQYGDRTRDIRVISTTL